MGKDKLKRFAENKILKHLIEPSLKEIVNVDSVLKNNWHLHYFKNDNPIILELACGRGEYTIALAKKYPDKNFIGIDIKGSRIWKGAKIVSEENMNNVCFLRIQIELIVSFFTANEVSEIWITFPDPQIKLAKKRLTSPRFINLYKNILKENASINLKTDSSFLYKYTMEIIKKEKLNLISYNDDIYNTEIEIDEDLLEIQTTYENKFLEKKESIKYIKFSL